MKRIIIFLSVLSAAFSLCAQTADFEVLGFVDPEGHPIDTLSLSPDDGLRPLVRLVNHGPDVIAHDDVLHLDIYFNDSLYISHEDIAGQNLQGVTAGDSFRTGRHNDLLTSAEMDEMLLVVPFKISYVVSIEGQSVDPVAGNNKADAIVDRHIEFPWTGIGGVAGGSAAVYPNPACRRLHIGHAENTAATLFDLSGRAVLNENIVSDMQTIDVSNLPEGLYILRLHDGSNTTVRKVSIIR